VRGQDLRIPLVNLDRQFEYIRDEVRQALDDVISDKQFILGPHVERFEAQFAAFQEVPHAIGCSNGTAAISLALEALGVGDGDEVVTVGHTFAATAGGIIAAGAVPVFVDIEPGTYCIDVERIPAAVTKRTKAVMPVDIYGTIADMPRILDVARDYKLLVIEDAAQAHGARLNGQRAGALPAAATFSFYPGKNLGAIGDAGAVVTADAEMAHRIRRLRDHGRDEKYWHPSVGRNERMDGIQAAVLSVKLKHLEKWNARRREIAKRYDEAFMPRGFKVIAPRDGSEPAYHLYVVELSNRDAVVGRLRERSIASGVHYPVPLFDQPAFRDCRLVGDGAVTRRAASRVLSVPICPELTDSEQSEIIEAVVSVGMP
jgi:dTDP-4-amino-4,6-dideoxygalactose transaminase